MASKDIKLSDATAILAKLGSSIKKHSSILFIVAASTALIYSVSRVNYALNTASDEAYRATQEANITSSQFDKTTINKIDELGNRQSTPEPTIPSGRINPFVE